MRKEKRANGPHTVTGGPANHTGGPTKHTSRRIQAGLLAVCLTLGAAIPSGAWAAGKDPRQAVSGDEATLTMGKILTANHAGKFPGTLRDVKYKLTAVRGFDNANESTGASGKPIAAENMPMPEASAAEHHQIKVTGTNAEITVGDFQTAEWDSDTKKSRVTPVKIKFRQAGYYLYKLTEEGSDPEKVPGVTYDNHSYFVAVYVTNKTDDAGNTEDGVYVHNITSYRNESGKENYRPNLSDISGITDNGGTDAKENVKENLAKVGSSDSEHPNQLEAYRFWNDAHVQDLVITNNVKGNLGDRNKAFEFQVTLSGLEPGTAYTTEEAAADTGDRTCESVNLVRASVGTIQGKTVVSDESGKAEFTLRLRDDEKFVLNGLPVSAAYQVTEQASDHIASYQISGSGKTPEILKKMEANDIKEKALTTEAERVDAEDGTVTVAFTNERNLATVTGVAESTGPAALLAIAAAGAIAARRRKYE